AQLLAPWQTAYSDSKVIASAVTTTHLVALLFGGGLAIAADRATLRIPGDQTAERHRQLTELRAVHPPALIALSGLFGGGRLRPVCHLDPFLASRVVPTKLARVAPLAPSGVRLMRPEARLRALAGIGRDPPPDADPL